MPLIFVTVGSTYFDSLIDSLLSPSVLAAISSEDFTRLIVQYGKGALPAGFTEGVHSKGDVEVELFKFKDGLQDMVERADLVISHAGISALPKRSGPARARC